jgi:hypothetical protein
MTRYGVLLIAFAALLVGCNKLSKANYDKLKVGMGYDEVVAIFGRPDSCSVTYVAKGCKWGDEGKNVTIGFIDDKVILYKSTNIN